MDARIGLGRAQLLAACHGKRTQRLLRDALHVDLPTYTETLQRARRRSRLQPFVLGPSRVPQVVDEIRAKSDRELAVLSARAYQRRVPERTNEW